MTQLIKTPLEVLSAEYIASAVKAEQYPEEECSHIAFVGRSNVGKSSLINSLCRRHGLARVSGTPGKTQTLNFYRLLLRRGEMKEKILFVDLPGYGYAKRAQRQRTSWGQFIEDYLMESPHLKVVFQLIDIRHPALESDLAVYEWLKQSGVPVQLIATKVDKLSRGAIAKQLALLGRQTNLSAKEILKYSSLKGIGREETLDVIGRILVL